MTPSVVIVWAILLVAAFFYTRRARHPDAKPLAAYLIFVTVFSAVAFVLFGAALSLLQATGTADLMDRPSAILALLAFVFVPAFLAGRWQLRKPPRAPRYP
jgi:hypothetical protein